MHNTTCPLCRFRSAKDQYTSSLGTTPICWECFIQHAEDPAKIAKAVRHIDAGNGNLEDLQMILSKATVCVSEYEGYISLQEYNSRAKRQVAPIPKEPPANHEALELANLDFVTKAILRVNPDLPRELPSPRTGQLQQFIQHLDTFYPWVSLCLSSFSTSYCGCRPAFSSFVNRFIRLGQVAGK